MTKILVADDHAVVREGLKQILSETADMKVVDEASSGQEVLNKVIKQKYDVVVLDISMPGGSGIEILKQLKKVRPNLPVLILSIHPEEQYAVRLLKAGASGYLTKESAAEELVKALRKVAKGRKYITSSLAEKLAFDLELDSSQPPHEKLSDREYQVMRLIASGRSVKQIADELFLSEKTISTYKSRILNKMKMKSSAQIIRYALKENLVD